MNNENFFPRLKRCPSCASVLEFNPADQPRPRRFGKEADFWYCQSCNETVEVTVLLPSSFGSFSKVQAALEQILDEICEEDPNFSYAKEVRKPEEQRSIH